MDKLEREKYKKKLKFYEALGAKKFQKVVFKVEKLKFKVMDKLFPNFIDKFEKKCDKKQKKLIKKAKSQEEVERIKEYFAFSKMAMRKEMNQKQNRNYHIDIKKPTEINQYLNWNKKVHERGIIINIISTTALGIILAAGFTFAIPAIVLEVISAAINFQCVNIQNYNICRYKLVEEKLIKREEKRTEKNIENYGSAQEVICKSIKETEKLPSFDEILKNIKTKEQLIQMKEMFKESQIDRNKQLVRGEK